MNDKCFLDTNIIVYLFDTSEPDKRRKAKKLFVELQKNKRGYISAQVVNEFIVITSQKITHPLGIPLLHLRWKAIALFCIPKICTMGRLLKEN